MESVIFAVSGGTVLVLHVTPGGTFAESERPYLADLASNSWDADGDGLWLWEGHVGTVGDLWPPGGTWRRPTAAELVAADVLPGLDILSILRSEPYRDTVVWRDLAGACLCLGEHQHHGDVTAARLADLVEAGDERATEWLRTIVLQGLVMMAAQARR